MQILGLFLQINLHMSKILCNFVHGNVSLNIKIYIRIKENKTYTMTGQEVR